MKKKYLNIFLLLFPFIDFLTSIATWNQNNTSIGLIIKGLFLLFALYYILKNCQNKKIKFLFLLLAIYLLFTSFYWYKTSLNIKTEIINIIKIYYFPILILFFTQNKEKIKCQTIILIYLEFLLLYLIPYPFNMGHNIKEIYPNKDLYLSYFYIGNELANIFILLIPPVFFQTKDKKQLFIITLLTLLMLTLLGTKTTYLSILIIIIYFIIKNRQKILEKIKKFPIIIAITSSLIFLGVLIWLPKSTVTKNIKTSLNYYEVNSVTELLTIENINNIIYSNRLNFLKNIHEKYQDLNILQKLMGLGRTKINQTKDIEIDLFDIFYSIGIIGFIIYLFFFKEILKYVKIDETTKFSFILLCIISLFTGHVLISPMTTSYLSALFGLERKQYENMDQKSIQKIKNSPHAK